MDRIRNGNVLPYGDQLKNLLWDSTISESDLRKFLRRRGVFVPGNDKKDLIPHLTTSVLSPEEFESLREMYVFKRETPKQRSSSITFEQHVDFSDVLPSEINPQSIIDEDFLSFSIIGIPSFEFFGDGGDGVRLQYELEHVDPSKSWFQEKTTSKGEVRYERNSGCQYSIIKKHTSKETERVNREIVRFIEKKLRENNKLGESQAGNKINFRKFNNVERISYFVKLLKKPSSVFKFQKITDVDVKPDVSSTLPDTPEIKWMEDRINRLRLHGTSLEDTFFIKASDYHTCLIFPRLEAEFMFDTDEAKGKCSVCLNFADYPKNADAELEVTVFVKTFDPKIGHANINKTRDFLLDVFDRLKMDLFLKHLSVTDSCAS